VVVVLELLIQTLLGLKTDLLDECCLSREPAAESVLRTWKLVQDI